MNAPRTRVLEGLALALALAGCRVTDATAPTPGPLTATEPVFDPTPQVDPFIGTAAHGHTFPGATRPFGMVQLGPDTRLTGWDGCSGYHYDDAVVYGFSHTHLSGTGVADYADVLLMPTVGAEPPAVVPEHPYAARFDHSSEVARPGLYAVRLGNPALDVELTATARVGIHRYTRYAPSYLPPGSEALGLVLDLRHRDEVIEAWVEQVSPTELVGLRRSRGWARDQRVYFAMQLSRPLTGVMSLAAPATAGATRWEGHDVRLQLDLGPVDDEPLVVKVALSGVDVEGARRNLATEAPHWDFDAYVKDAHEAWRAALAAVEVEGGTEAQRRTFYTGLYHSMLAPNVFEDVDGRYRGMDLEVHDSPGFTAYTVFSLWDTFRATHPLLVILQPERATDFVRTLLAQARTGGHLVVWELFANETWTMIGYHAVSVIADAWAKGLRGFDAEEALRAAIASADADRFGLPGYRAQGYVPAEQEHESVSKTLEYAYDDWCIATLADALGHTDVRDRFLRRAQSWGNLFDPGSGLFRARENGGWLPGFDPREVNLHYTEANAWQYGFFVPHDVGGLVARHGGPAALERRLDQLFTAPSELAGRQQVDITGLVGQYAHGNEPSHHVAYLYPYVGQAPKTQARVRQIMDTLYTDAPDGLTGNDDCGQLSSWYVLSALGFYPLAPGTDEYVIGSPLFPRATIHLPGERAFVIEARGVSSEAIYVQSATLNGTPHATALLRHADIVSGGHLVLQMGTEPNPGWGAIEPPPPLAAGPAPALPAPLVEAASQSFAEELPVSLRIEAGQDREGLEIRYTRGSEPPGPGSPRYPPGEPIVLRETTTITTAVFDGEQRGPVVTATFHRRRDGMTATLAVPPHRAYQAGGAAALLDGRRGSERWQTGGWLGWQGVDVEATLALARPTTVREVSVGLLQDARSWIWMPRHLEVEVSTDGERWRPFGRATHDVPVTEMDRVVVRPLAVTGKATKIRFIRLRAPTLGTIPAWHPGAGGESFVFIDEVMVE